MFCLNKKRFKIKLRYRPRPNVKPVINSLFIQVCSFQNYAPFRTVLSKEQLRSQSSRHEQSLSTRTDKMIEEFVEIKSQIRCFSPTQGAAGGLVMVLLELRSGRLRFVSLFNLSSMLPTGIRRKVSEIT